MRSVFMQIRINRGNFSTLLLAYDLKDRSQSIGQFFDEIALMIYVFERGTG